MSRSVLDISDAVTADLINLLVGKELGRGESRQTHVCLTDTSLVVKIEHSTYTRDNAMEWEIWNCAKGTHLERWLAPCVTISERNCVLIQRRTQPIPVSRLPKKVPKVLADTKRENWGLVERGGRTYAVCHDYANHNLWRHGVECEELVTPTWHNPDYTGWGT